MGMTAEQAFQQAYALSMGYTKESLLGGGAVVGKNVTIQSIDPIDGGKRVTFSYTLDDGTQKTSTLDVMDGKDGADGKNGLDGLNGKDGVPGFSPTIEPNPYNNDEVYKLNITDVNHTFTTENLKGNKGNPGQQGIPGEKGDQGEQGVQGIQGVQGTQGDPFLIYKEYENLLDFDPDDFKAVGQMFGLKPSIEGGNYDVYRFAGKDEDPQYTFVTSLGLSESIRGEQGPQGMQGIKGEAGKDGTTYTPTIGTVESGEDASANVVIKGENAEFSFVIPKGDPGEAGKDGRNGQDGKTYTPAIGTVQTGEEAAASVDIDEEELKAKFNFTFPSGGKSVTDYEDLDNLPKLGGKTIKGDNNLAYYGIQPKGDYVTNEELSGKGYLTSVPTMTEDTLGIGKPDGKTITVDEDGTMHSVGAEIPTDKFVPETREIAGIDLSEDISGEDLRDALSVSKEFTGTTEEFEAAKSAGQIEEGMIVNITDDYEEGGGSGGGDIDNMTPKFEEAKERENIENGDTISTIFGKIKKVIADLAKVAFSGKYDDLTGTPTALKNPQALTFTGNSTETYDGSAEKTVNIPDLLDSMEQVDANTNAGHGVDALVVKEIYGSLDWKFFKSVAGKTEINLPDYFDELYIEVKLANGDVFLIFDILNIALTSTSKQYRTGYYSSSNNYAEARINVTKTTYRLSVLNNNTGDVGENVTSFIYYH